MLDKLTFKRQGIEGSTKLTCTQWASSNLFKIFKFIFFRSAYIHVLLPSTCAAGLEITCISWLQIRWKKKTVIAGFYAFLVVK
jgi:hypothetical protein